MKEFSKNIVTRNVKFSAAPGGGNIGACICLSFKDATYVRVEALENAIVFKPVKKVADDGAFYTKYIRNQNRIFVPRTLLECYRTTEGYELLGRSVPRIIVDGGYGACVKKVKEFSLSDAGIDFRIHDVPFTGFSPSEKKESLLRQIAATKKKYTIIDLYFGDKAAAIITPTDDVDGIPSASQMRNWFGYKLQFFCGQHLRFFTLSEIFRIPRIWYKQFPDNDNKFPVYTNGTQFLVQMENECIVDGAKIQSAEYNSGERYICQDCQDAANNNDEELLTLVKGLIDSYNKMKEKCEAAMKESAMYKAKAELLDEAFDTSGMSTVSLKLHKQRMAEKNKEIAALKAENEKYIPDVKYLDFSEI